MRWTERRTRQVGILAGAVVAFGIAIAATVSSTVGGVVTLAGWALCLVSLHRFGRVGAD